MGDEAGDQGLMLWLPVDARILSKRQKGAFWRVVRAHVAGDDVSWRYYKQPREGVQLDLRVDARRLIWAGSNVSRLGLSLVRI
jgi:hypothetical protein